jgi:membrane-bound metal-dependent hydrolase YbcI (DUF457 family)
VVAGHFGFAAGVKARERQVPLWALMLATAWLDVVFVPLLLLGVERLEPVPGTKGGYGNSIIHADYTHSLVGALVLAAAFGLVAAWPWGRRAGVVLAAVVFSHWILDLIVHRGDMPVLPADLGGLPRLGFGLWRFPLASALLELAIVLAGCLLYWRSALQTADAGHAPRGRAHLVGGLALAAGILVLVLDAVLAL